MSSLANKLRGLIGVAVCDETHLCCSKAGSGGWCTESTQTIHTSRVSGRFIWHVAVKTCYLADKMLLLWPSIDGRAAAALNLAEAVDNNCWNNMALIDVEWEKRAEIPLVRAFKGCLKLFFISNGHWNQSIRLASLQRDPVLNNVYHIQYIQLTWIHHRLIYNLEESTTYCYPSKTADCLCISVGNVGPLHDIRIRTASPVNG